jgi:hypothetical protein
MDLDYPKRVYIYAWMHDAIIDEIETDDMI